MLNIHADLFTLITKCSTDLLENSKPITNPNLIFLGKVN